MRWNCPAPTAARIAHQLALLTGQWNFPALLQRIKWDPDRHVRFGSNRVTLTVGRLLPVYPDKQTISEPVGTSHLCQKRM